MSNRFIKKSTNKSANQKKIERFDWNKKQECFHCGRQVFRTKAEQIFDFTATIDHIYPITDVRRYCQNGGKWVLSCHKCNRQRNMVQKTMYRSRAIELNQNDMDVVLRNILILGDIKL